MTLADGDIRWRTIEMGASSVLGARWDTLSGLGGVPRHGADNPPPARLRDQAVPGWATIGYRTITALGLKVGRGKITHADAEESTADEVLAALRSAMADQDTVDHLIFRDLVRSTDDLMVAAVADVLDDTRDKFTYTNRAYTPTVQWLAADPTVYSAQATTPAPTEGGPDSTQTIHFTNAGDWATPSGRAWTLAITAVGGTVLAPYIENTTTGQRITWPHHGPGGSFELHAGQTLTVDTYRRSKVGTVAVDNIPRTGVTLFCDWPILQPGANEIVVGCWSGTVSASFTARSTWR
jgi:hypothetical protein